MNLNRMKMKETFVPATAALLLMLGASACNGDKTSVQKQTVQTFEDTVELCTEAANVAFKVEFVDVENDLTTAVDEAYEAATRRATEGDAFLQSSLEDCVATNFFEVVDGLVIPQINQSEDTAEANVTVTTELGN